MYFDAILECINVRLTIVLLNTLLKIISRNLQVASLLRKNSRYYFRLYCAK